MNKKNTKYWIMGLIAVIVIMGLTFPFFMAKSSLNAEIAKLRKEGLPVTPREFADKYYKPIPKAENAADTFDEAYSLYVELEDDKNLIIAGFANPPKYDQKIASVLLEIAKEFIKGNKDLLNKMSELRKYDRIHFDYEWEKGYEILLPRLTKIRNTARIYAVNAELIINQNNSQKAEELLKEMFHLGRLASQSPFMIGQLVFYACDAIALRRMERCMNTITFSSGQLKEFENICAEHEKYVIRRYPDMLKTELAFVLSMASYAALKKYDYFSPYNSYPYIKDIPKKYRVLFYYHSGSYYNDITAQVKSSKAIMKVPVDIYVKRKARLEKIRDDNKASSNFMLSASYISFYLKALRIIACLRCAATACAVERFHLKYKKLPEKLEQLVPEFLEKVPIDPFDGKPLRYFRGKFDMRYDEPLPPKEVKKKKPKEKKKKDSVESMFGAPPQVSSNKGLDYKKVTLKKSGFYIYSIGSDLKDDSSLPLWERRINKDVLFIVIDKNNGSK